MKRDNFKKFLVREIDYQKEYSYEQRMEIFNKYLIGTTIKYINPIMLLTRHLQKLGDEYYQFSDMCFYGVSHSGAVQSSFNKNLEPFVNDNFLGKLETESLTVLHNHAFDYYTVLFRGSRQLAFRVKDEECKFQFFQNSLWFTCGKVVDVAKLANEFMKDFGFEEIF